MVQRQARKSSACLRTIAVRRHRLARGPYRYFEIASLSLMSALSCLGCGLSNSQMSAVQLFSQQTKSFAAAPATVVTAYDDAYVTREAFETSTLAHVGGSGGIWKMTGGAVDTQATMAAQAKELTDALQIISRYGIY